MQITSCFLNLDESGVDLVCVLGFNVDEELVFPGATVNGPTFDFEQIDTMFRKRFERGEERARTVREAHRYRHFASGGRSKFFGIVRRAQQHKPGEVLGVVLNACGEDHAPIVFGGAAPGNGGSREIAARKYFADAASSVFGRNALQVWVCGEKSFALRESHGMRSNGAESGKRRARATDQVMLDGEDGLGDDTQTALQEKIVDAHNGTGEGVLDGREESVGETFVDRAKSSFKGGARHGGDGFAEKLHRSFLAESTRLALKGDPRRSSLGRFFQRVLPARGPQKLNHAKFGVTC